MTALWFEQQKNDRNIRIKKRTLLEEITKEVISKIQRIDKNQEFKMLDNENKPKIKCPQCNKGFLQRIKSKNGIVGGGVVINLNKIAKLCIVTIMENLK